MRILIISMNVGRNSPGIVFEKIIQGLSEIHEVDLITSDYEPSIDLKNLKSKYEIKKYFHHPRIYKFLISLFSIDPMDLLWSQRVIFSRFFKQKDIGKYDLILSLISFHHYASLIAGVELSKLGKNKLAVYSVDAIPAPLGWSENDQYFRGVNRMMNKYLSKVDYFFSGNEQMLKYQLTTFHPKPNLISSVIYNPNFGQQISFLKKDPDKIMFLYTGGVYGIRTPEFIIKAFIRILKDYPDSTLEFVGSVILQEYLIGLTKVERDAIKIHPFTNELKPFYEKATALIDIDANIENDVFLSGKMVNYISIDRIIISQTGKNSPSRKLFKDVDSIFHCGHNIEEIENAMRKAIRFYNQDTFQDFKDRKNLIEMFSLPNIIQKLNKIISDN